MNAFAISLEHGDYLLREGLHWDAWTQNLWGVDIHGCRLWKWNLSEGKKATEWLLNQRIGWVLSTSNPEKLLLGLQGGFALANKSDPTHFKWIHQPFLHSPSLRLNDAKADIAGSVWAGSLNNDNETRADGCLFHLSIDGTLKIIEAGYMVANGPAIHADSKTLLHTDSGFRTIYAFDLSVTKGLLTNKRIWKVFSEQDGHPDGMCFDADGCVWVAHWGGGCISRFSPDGDLLRRIKLPTSQITNICFAGPDLDRLFVSSARVGLTRFDLENQPLAGSLFEILDPGVRGLPSLSYGG